VRPARYPAGVATRQAPAEPRVYTRSVPPDVAGPFQALTGIDVAGIPVHRGPAVSEQARAYRARAFTRAGEIFLPDEAGPLGHSDTQALLAHELTHAVQQRVLSSSLPDEASQHGQELEHEARQAEDWYRSGGSPPPRLAHLPVATLLAGHAGLATVGGGAPASASGVGWTSPMLPSGPAATSGVQRQDEGPAPAPAAAGQESAYTVSTQPGTGQPESNDMLLTALGTGAVSTLPGLSAMLDGTLAASPILGGPSGLAAGSGSGTKELAELAEHSERLVKLAGKRPPDLDDPASLDELATKVYPLLRGMVRAELLVDRERAGLLADPS
jgi:hypothetical protein